MSGLSANSISQLLTFVLPPSSCTPTCNFTTSVCSNNFFVASTGYPFLLTGECGTSINDANACTSTPYRDFSGSMSCNLSKGSTYIATVGQSVGNQNSAQIWIDFNSDGSFATSESVGGTVNWTTGRATPGNCCAGKCGERDIQDACYCELWHRLRHALSSLNIPPCPTTAVNYAETRDYKVTIVNAQPGVFSYTGSVQTFTVPTGVTNLGVDVRGAMGGKDYLNYSTNSGGGRVQCNLAVTPGQVLYVYVGGRGADGTASTGTVAGGFNGGGSRYYLYSGSGGGASDIRTSASGTSYTNRLIVAGGGGGAGYNCSGTNQQTGGAGGGTTGVAGRYCGSVNTGNCGQGGTQTAGGAAATSLGGSAL